jgi:hypothetical protein
LLMTMRWTKMMSCCRLSECSWFRTTICKVDCEWTSICRWECWSRRHTWTADKREWLVNKAIPHYTNTNDPKHGRQGRDLKSSVATWGMSLSSCRLISKKIN